MGCTRSKNGQNVLSWDVQGKLPKGLEALRADGVFAAVTDTITPSTRGPTSVASLFSEIILATPTQAVSRCAAASSTPNAFSNLLAAGKLAERKRYNTGCMSSRSGHPIPNDSLSAHVMILVRAITPSANALACAAPFVLQMASVREIQGM